jgi:lysophospholipase L1-like esterase
MKTILAFGDSLTWGADPDGGGRHPHDSLWPTVLERALDGRARVITEGLGGRTTAFDDWTGPCDRNGARVLPVLLASHMPLDLVVVMLGTNDLKPWICGHALGATAGMRRLAQIVRAHPYDKPGFPVPAVLLVAPPACRDARDGAPAADRSIAESQRITPLYRALADELGTAFFDAGTVAAASPIDGVHLDAAQTSALGQALAAPVHVLI